MPPTLFFDGKLLSSGVSSGSALVRIEGGAEITVRFQPSGIALRSRDRGDAWPGFFVTRLVELPKSDIEWLREVANRDQKYRHDNAPEYEYPRRGGGLLPTRNNRGKVVNGRGIPVKWKPRIEERVPLTKPPKTIELADDYSVRINSHSLYNGYRCLEVGKQLTIKYGDHSRSIGTIKEFVLTPPRPS